MRLPRVKPGDILQLNSIEVATGNPVLCIVSGTDRYLIRVKLLSEIQLKMTNVLLVKGSFKTFSRSGITDIVIVKI